MEDVCKALRRHKLLALGNFGQFSKKERYNYERDVGWYESVPSFRTRQDFQNLVQVASRSRNLVSVDLHNPRNLFRTPAQQSEALAGIASALRRSRWICVNLGEYELASDDAYAQLLESIKASNVGYLYLDDRRVRGTLKRQFLNALQHNRNEKVVYKLQVARPDVSYVLHKGCKAWKNPAAMPLSMQRAQSYVETDESQKHCKRGCRASRCKGVSSRGKRCCLCTKNPSGFCRFHELKVG